nr:MAG TPA: hypothetical protein [Caudoviricetes sp.]
MNVTVLKTLNIAGVDVEICISNEKEEDTTKQFIYELLNFDNA